MSSTPEGKVKEKIKRVLKRHGAYYTMPVMTGMATNGTPDFAVCFAGLYLAIEAKSGPSAKPTALQWVRLNEVAAAGGSTMVLHDQNLDVLDSWLNAAKLGVLMQTTALRDGDNDRVTGHSTVLRGGTPEVAHA